MKNFKGFTLIELLVVISIIGVISSVIFVSFSGSRDKARLAKAQNFDAQVSHALGAYAVGIWRFEEGTGIDIHDESGFGNDGTFSGNPTPVFPDSEVYPGTKALYFDGSNDYVDCGHGSSLNVVDAITLEAWIKLSGSINGHIRIIDHEGATQFCLTGPPSGGNKIMWRIGGWNPQCISDKVLDLDKWYHVVGIFSDTENKAKIYINGVLDKEIANTNTLSPSSKNLNIGRYTEGGYFFNGAIDNVCIYNHALSSAQIQQHYSAGAITHGIALNDKQSIIND